jgi:hypothetical protein
MTEEEAAVLDEKWTKTTPKVGPNGSGFIAKRKAAAAHTITIDELSADYLFAKAIAEHKTPAEVLSDIVHEKLAVASAG